MASSSPSSLPFLPNELMKEILKFCDQPTLAKTSTLSLAFLQLSSPLLYRHITIRGPESMDKFLTLVVRISGSISDSSKTKKPQEGRKAGRKGPGSRS